jgi:hypothetical protein
MAKQWMKLKCTVCGGRVRRRVEILRTGTSLGMKPVLCHKHRNAELPPRRSRR